MTDRFLRHMGQLSLTPFEDSTLTTIYSTIMKWHFENQKFVPSVQALAEKLVSATKDIYAIVSTKLLPTPAKTHYTYNLRDVSRVMQGLLMSSSDRYDDPNTFIRLWIHEVHRVFCDRLINEEDGMIFLDQVKAIVKARFNVNFEKVMAVIDSDGDGLTTTEEMRSLFFGDYISRKAPRPYVAITDMNALEQVWKNYLEEYNALSSRPMPLVLFRFAVEHLSRIARILKQTGGHALLVGLGGSGKQSLTRLAAYVMEYEVQQIELTRTYDIDEWQTDLRALLKKAGGEGKPTVFLFSDSQMRKESFLEDINSLLNTAQVPNLWPAEELNEVLELCRADAKKNKRNIDGTHQALFAHFTERVRANLHIVLCMSPIGGAFRERLRMFPSLVNCCTIDWFQAWPKEALYWVANSNLQEIEMEEKIKASCVDVCIKFHHEVEKLSADFYEKLRRHTYVTPTSYLELITTFKALLSNKRKETMKQRGRYQTGLDKLQATEKAVKTMQIELEDMQPALQRTSEETDEMMKVVTKETEEAQKIRDAVQKEEKIAADAANTAKGIERECASDLAEAMPLLEAAISALDTLTPQEISEVKAMRSPPKGVKLVMEALCVMKRIPPARVPDPSGSGKMIIDYWEPAKKYILSDPRLLKSLINYDKDNIPPKVIKKIRQYISMPDFDMAKIKNVSRAAHSLCSWIYAIEAYDRVVKQVKPKKEALAKARAEYEHVKAGLDGARSELNKVEMKISALRNNLTAMQEEKQELENKMQQCSVKLERAHKLLGRLGGEKTRWTAIAAQLGIDYANLTGDVLVSAGVIAYLGPFTAAFRQGMINEWISSCKSLSIPISDSFSLGSVLSDAVQIRRWVIEGLPNDTFSIDNAIIISRSRRWPLMIDPQNQANKWVKNMEKENKLVVIKANDDYMRALENAIQFGAPVLMENVGEDLDPSLEPLLLKNIFKKGTMRVLRFGEQDIEYSDQFKFYMTTKLRNPHYLPEIQVKVTLLNFSITPEGLEDQLLGIVVAKEKPDLENERSRLVVTSAGNQSRLKEIEDKILQVLSQSKGNILDDENAIEVLSASKVISNEIEEKQKIAEKTEKEIDASRMGYKPVAFHASVLFFCIADLGQIDPMYQYSLSWFINLFKAAIEASEFSHILLTRISSLNDYFSYSLYTNVCRSLFQKDRLLFSFMLSTRLLKAASKIDIEEWRFLLTGGVTVDRQIPPNPVPSWLSEKAWVELCRLSAFPRFRGLSSEFSSLEKEWKALYDSGEPQKINFPGKWSELDGFGRMILLRTMRPDKIIPAVREFIGEHLGEKFMEALPFDLQSAYNDSGPDTPLIFVLSPGSDPMSALLKFAQDMDMNDKVNAISLGQGQGPIAAKLIEKGMKEGSWVILQNCHLAASWMPTLERITDAINMKTAHNDFRLILTSYPSDYFPVSILQNGIKLTTESYKGLRANMQDSYMKDPINEEKFFASCKKQKELKNMVFALSFFHALVQERRTYGPLGWNISYGFNDSDFRISVRQLHMFLNEYEEIPYKALNYLIGELNYGGRVTDDWDRRTLTTLLTHFISPEIHKPTYALSSASALTPTSITTMYKIPMDGPLSSYLDYIRSFPQIAPPDVFGFHENADITKAQKETNELFASILLTEARHAGGKEASKNSILEDLSSDILKKLPARFDIDVIAAKYPVQYSESMNSVLTQECIRFNKLTDTIRNSLQSLKKALIGEVVMSQDLELLAQQMFDGHVPSLWQSVSYASLKPLGGYISDLNSRLKFFHDWIDHDAPSVVWISGFFFIQSFLTGVMQNYARKARVAIDEVAFDFEFLSSTEENKNHTTISSTSSSAAAAAAVASSPVSILPRPESGAYIRGLYLEGARWDATYKRLSESTPKVLFTPAPIIWLKPCRVEEVKEMPHYACPVYRTSARKGTLSTTGHSTNFVMTIRIPCAESPAHWIRRGVALITQLDD